MLRYIQAFKQDINQEILIVQQQLEKDIEQANKKEQLDAAYRGKSHQSVPPVQHIVTLLDIRLERLEYIRNWIEEDEELAHLIDSIMSKQVKASERRQLRINIMLNIIFLFAGWGLSLVGTPLALLQRFAEVLNRLGQ